MIMSQKRAIINSSSSSDDGPPEEGGSGGDEDWDEGWDADGRTNVSFEESSGRRRSSVRDMHGGLSPLERIKAAQQRGYEEPSPLPSAESEEESESDDQSESEDEQEAEEEAGGEEAGGEVAEYEEFGHRERPKIWPSPSTMTTDEYDEIAHLLGEYSIPDWEDTIKIIFGRNDLLKAKVPGNETLRSEIINLLQRRRKVKEARALMKDTGWTRSSTGRPPIEALRLLEEECPTWFESFRMRLMFIGAFVYIATHTEFVNPHGQFTSELRTVANYWKTVVCARGRNTLDFLCKYALDPQSFTGSKASRLEYSYRLWDIHEACRDYRESWVPTFLPSSEKTWFKIDGMERLREAVTVVKKVSFEPKNMPSVLMSDDYGMSVLIKHNASLVGVIYGGGEAVFNNTVLNASVVDEIFKFVCRLADDSDGRYIDYLLKHDVRVCPFCAVQDARCRGTCSGCTSWKEAMFNAKPCTDPCISTWDDDAVTRLLVKASPVLSLMIEDESDDEDAAHQVMNVVKGMHSIEDIRTLALFIVRFGISMQNGTHVVLNKSKFKWTTDGKTEDEVARSRAFIDAVLSVVGETPRAAYSEEIASFVRFHMLSQSMIRLIHYLQILPAWEEIQRFMGLYRAAHLMETFVETQETSITVYEPRPRLLTVRTEEVARVDVPVRNKSAWILYSTDESVKSALEREWFNLPWSRRFVSKSKYVQQRLREQWKTLEAATKQRYVDQAAADKARYQKEMQAFDPPEGHPMHRKTPEKKKKKKRPASAAADGETKKKATTTVVDLTT